MSQFKLIANTATLSENLALIDRVFSINSILRNLEKDIKYSFNILLKI